MTTTIFSCARCRTVLLPGESQCLVCGADSEVPTRPCPVCGHAMPLPARFCTQCGHALQEPTATVPEPVTEAEFVKVRNPGTKFYAGIGGTVALLLALISIHSFVAATFFTPQRAVTGYLDALAARDARTALSYLEPIHADGLLLTDEVLKHEGYRPPENITVGEVPAEGDRRLVPVGFELDGKSYSWQLFVRRTESRTLGVFQGWLVEGGLLPLAIAAPRGVLPAVNGVTIPQSATGPLFVFPGQYRVGIADHPLLEMKGTIATVADEPAEVRLSPTPKASMRAEVEAAVKSYVDGCARSPELKPQGCPFAVTAPSPVTGVRWNVRAYPRLALSIDPETAMVNVSSEGEGRADATGTLSDGTPFSRSDAFRVSGTAALVDGKVKFTAR